MYKHYHSRCLRFLSCKKGITYVLAISSTPQLYTITNLLHVSICKNLLKWNSYESNHFKMRNSVPFSIIRMLCNPLGFIVKKHFLRSKTKLCIIEEYSSSSPCQGNHHCFFVSTLSILNVSEK